MAAEATEHLAARLTDTLGADAVLAGADCAAYRVQGSVPAVVARPASVEQVSAALAVAAEAGATVIPWGSGSRMALGYPPRAATLVLSLERMHRVLAHDPADLTVSVEAGCTHAELERQLAAAGQMLPLDVPLPARATIGGTLATGMAGPRRGLYGGPRDLLLGVRAVDAAGTITHAGGRVVKNVTGYDLTKLYLGSLGTLAVLVEANFKLLPLPAAEASVVVGCASAVEALRVAAALCELAVAPAAVCAAAGEDLASRGAWHEAPPGAALVVARFPGTASAVARAVDDARTVAQARTQGAGQLERLDAAGHAACWPALRDFPSTVDVADDEAVLKVSVLPSELDTVLETATTMAAEHALDLDWLADACVGTLYLRVRPQASAGNDPAPGLEPGLLALQGMLAHRWRNAVVLACPVALKARLPLWGADPPGLDLMRAIKHQFDPAGLLNPGRFVGGL